MSLLLLHVGKDILAFQFSGQTKQTENNFGSGRTENILVNPKQEGFFQLLCLVTHRLENKI